MQNFFSLSLFLLLAPIVVCQNVLADVERPDRKYLFDEDSKEKEIRKREKAEIRHKKEARKLKAQQKADRPFDINAKSMQFVSGGKVVEAEGDVIITYSTIVAEAERASVNTEQNDAQLDGNVRIGDVTFSTTADSAKINLDSGVASFENLDMVFDDGNYRLLASHADRDDKDILSLEDAEFFTCKCPEGDSCRPWSLTGSEARVARESYGEIWDATLNVQDVPVLYLPYLIFPTKKERQSGFLPFTFGSGRENGFKLRAPFYWAIDHSIDATITGVYDSSTRAGVDLEFRKFVSLNHTLRAGLVYLNESQRDGDLQGTIIDGLDDPTIDEDRLGAFVDQSWRGEPIGPLRFQWILDGRYVSDDLFPREYDKEKIAKFNSRFVTSRGVLRTPLGGNFTADLSAEWNQAIVDDDDFVFQRLPALSLFGVNTLKPFGENSFGAKLIFSTEASAINFSRKKSYDGSRTELYEKVKLPFFYKNYLDGSVEGSLRASHYSLSETGIVEETVDGDINTGVLDSSSNRVIPGVTLRLGSTLERIYDVPKDSYFKRLVELGQQGRVGTLARLKHTVEPRIKYQYIPSVGQEDNPQFDSSDRLAEKSVVTYGLVQRLFARLEPRGEYLYGIEETAPELKDLGNLRSASAIDRESTFDLDPPYSKSYRSFPRGKVVELANFELSQSFDILEDRKNENTGDSAFSDLEAKLTLLPNEYFRFKFGTDFDLDTTEFNSYLIQGELRSKRGDRLISRLRFVRDSVRQLETSAELKLTEYTRLGYYSRYDDIASEFVEHKGGIRFLSRCNCWKFDISVSDQTNPNETKFAFTLTLVGLGEIGNTFFSDRRGESL